MNFRIKIPNGTTYLELPCREKEIQNFCQNLGLPNTANLQIEVESVSMNDRATAIFAGNTYNIDKLNYLAKRLDSFDKNELTTFYAVAYGEKLESVDSLINLTFNTHCASVVGDFSDLQATGKKMYLTEKIGATTRELQELDGEKYFQNVIANNPNPTVTPYGIIYKNKNEYEQVFDGTHFPQYEWEPNLGCITLGKNGFNEYLYLPFEETELTKALQRLDTEDVNQCSIELDSEFLTEEITACILEGESLQSRVNQVSEFSKKYAEVGVNEKTYIDTMVDTLQPQNFTDLNVLMDSLHEFEYLPNISTAEEYGRYMICDSGHFEYDENLEEYIDFEGYGNQRISRENGTFTNTGYLIYHGYNMDLSDMLTSLGLEISQEQTQELKLYMPLKATTYYDENDYGDLYQTDYEMDIYPSELAEYEDEILKAIERNALPEENKRGLMEYYGTADSVNAKVKRYDFSVENVRGELMGVATLQLNAHLNDKELDTIKQEISGQASDGWGEGFEQREIKVDNGKEIYVSFWNSGKDWSLQTGEELGISDQKHELTMGGM